MKLIITFILFCLFSINSSFAKDKDIYLPSVIMMEDQMTIRISYDEQKRIVSISNLNAMAHTYIDSTNISIQYDKEGRIKQKLQYSMLCEKEDINNILNTTNYTYNYDYTKKDTITLRKSKQIISDELNTYPIDTSYIKIYRDSNNTIIERPFVEKKDEVSITKTKFDKDGNISDYYQSIKTTMNHITTHFFVDEYINNKSIFENVNFVSNYNRTQLNIIQIFLVIDHASKIHVMTELTLDEKQNLEEKKGTIQYEYNESGYPIRLEMKDEQNSSKNTLITIEYIKL